MKEIIKLDLVPDGIMPVLHASQYDDGRVHGIEIYECGAAYVLDGTETLTINERKGDDCICTMDIENTFENTNSIEFASTEQMCAVWGNNLCELVLSKNGAIIGSLNFILEVERSPIEGGIQSESEINNLNRQIDDHIDEVLPEILGDDYYTKDETDNLLDDKANVSDVYAKSEVYNKSETDTLLNAKADKTYVDSFIDDTAEELQNKADKSNTYTKSEVDTIISNLPEPMVFKGTLGINGTITVLPAPSDENIGHTYIVITDGVYEGITAKVGDLFISSGTEWVLVPSGDEANDTWRAIKVNGVEVLGSAISSGSVDLVEGDNIEIVFNSTGNKVEIRTKNIYTKAEVDEIINSLLPTDTASGAIANFDTDLALPLKSYKASIVAQGGGGTPSTPIPISGFSSANVVHTKKNLFDYETVTPYNTNVTVSRNDGTITIQNNNSYALNALNGNAVYLKAGNYVISIGASIAYPIRVYHNNSYFAAGINAGNTSGTLTVSESGIYVLNCQLSGNSNLTIKNIQIEVGNQATAYEPYTGTTKAIDFGQTIYGGMITIE